MTRDACPGAIVMPLTIPDELLAEAGLSERDARRHFYISPDLREAILRQAGESYEP